VRLITAHRILILAGIAFFLFYALFQGQRFRVRGDVGSAVQAVVAVAIAIGFILYYRTLSRWGQR
jgi:hypothetical protein